MNKLKTKLIGLSLFLGRFLKKIMLLCSFIVYICVWSGLRLGNII